MDLGLYLQSCKICFLSFPLNGMRRASLDHGRDRTDPTPPVEDRGPTAVVGRFIDVPGATTNKEGS